MATVVVRYLATGERAENPADRVLADADEGRRPGTVPRYDGARGSWPDVILVLARTWRDGSPSGQGTAHSLWGRWAVGGWSLPLTGRPVRGEADPRSSQRYVGFGARGVVPEG